MPSIIACCPSEPSAGAAAAVFGGGSSLSEARRVFTAPSQGASVGASAASALIHLNGLGGLAVLLGGEREVEARLRLAGLLGERLGESLARLVGDDAAGGGDQGFAIGGAPRGVLAKQAKRLGIGMRRVLIAPETHVDWGEDHPTLAVVRLCDQVRLDTGDGRLDVAGRMGRGVATRERLVRHLRLAKSDIERKGDHRHADSDQNGGRQTTTTLGRVRRDRRFGTGGYQTPRRLCAGRRRFALRQLAAFDITLNLVELRRVELRFSHRPIDVG